MPVSRDTVASEASKPTGATTSSATSATRHDFGNNDDKLKGAISGSNWQQDYLQSQIAAGTTTAAAEEAAAAAAADEQAAIDAERTQYQQDNYNAAVAGANERIGRDAFDVFNRVGADSNNYQSEIDQYLADNVYYNPFVADTSIDNADFTGLTTNDLYSDQTGGLEGLLADITQTQYINPNQKAANSYFGDNYGASQILDTADDSYINEILSGQYADATGEIESALARGNLNQVGYDDAIASLFDSNTAGSSSLQNTGQGVLNVGRNTLDTTAGNAIADAGSYDFNDPYNLAGYQDTAANQLTDFNTNLEGNLRGAIGNEQFFDTNSILQGSGRKQGFINPAGSSNANPLLSAIASRTENESDNRGLGSTGSF